MFTFLTCPVLSANQTVKPRKHKQSVWSGSMWRGLSHGLLLDCCKLSSLWQMKLYSPQPSSTWGLWHPIGSNWIWQWKKGMTDDRAFWETPWSCLRKTEYMHGVRECVCVCMFCYLFPIAYAWIILHKQLKCMCLEFVNMFFLPLHVNDSHCAATQTRESSPSLGTGVI